MLTFINKRIHSDNLNQWGVLLDSVFGIKCENKPQQ